MKVTQLCPTLCDPMNYSLPGSSVHGILQAIMLEWVAFPFSRGSSQTRDQTQVSHWFLSATVAAAKSLQLCPTLCKPIDGSLPGSSVHGIFHARVLEWGATAFSKFLSSHTQLYFEFVSDLVTWCYCRYSPWGLVFPTIVFLS